MNKECKQYKVNIFGEEYALISDESVEHVMSTAQKVDSLMKKISEKSPILDAKQVAVYVALHMANEVIAMQQSEGLLKEKESDLVMRMDKVLASL